jgi:hypothetical protein
MKFCVKIDERLCVVSPNLWPSNHFGNDNKGIVVDKATAEIAKNEVTEMTGISFTMLVCEPIG